MNVPVVGLENCSFDKAQRRLILSSDFVGMPRELVVRSHHTGITMRFTVIGPEHRLFDQDQWDGEQQIYQPVKALPSVDHLIIANYT